MSAAEEKHEQGTEDRQKERMEQRKKKHKREREVLETHIQKDREMRMVCPLTRRIANRRLQIEAGRRKKTESQRTKNE